jgi:fucose permease
MLLGLVSEWPAALAAVAALGLGDGMLVAGAHNIITQSGGDIGRGFNRLNLYFAVGAIAGPLWTGALFAGPDSRFACYAGIAVLCVACSLLLFLVVRMPPTRPRADSPSAPPPRMTPAIWVMGGVLFLYVGAEFGLGSWVASYAERAAGAGTMTGAAVTSGYWGALMVGRLVSGSLAGRGHGPLAILSAALGGAFVTSTALALGGETIAVAFVAAFLTGLCFGPIWPSAVTIASAGSGAGARRDHGHHRQRGRHLFSLVPGRNSCIRGFARRDRGYGSPVPPDAGRYCRVQAALGRACSGVATTAFIGTG